MTIFETVSDYERFQKLLYLANSKASFHFDTIRENTYLLDRGEKLVAIGAYTLMPNHFHILVREINEGGISLFMKKLLTGYSMYFNVKNGRTGSLFQGPFRSVLASRDEYLKYLYSYIHLNRVKILDPKWKSQGIKNLKDTLGYVSNFKYSSYRDYDGVERIQKKILDTVAFPNYFSARPMKSEIIEWLEFNPVEKI
jgi:putative transposase